MRCASIYMSLHNNLLPLEIQLSPEFQVRSRDGKWDGCWLSCTPVNHLRFGGWLRAYQAEKAGEIMGRDAFANLFNNCNIL